MKKKIMIFTLIGIILTVLLTIVIYKHFNKNEKNETVEDNVIDLYKYDGNIVINKGGLYNVSGETKYPMIIDTNEFVKLVFNNVIIDTLNHPAIINLRENDFEIDLIDGTSNVLRSDGKNEENSVISSYGNLIINGHGSLEINSKLKNGEGISTNNKDITIDGPDITIKSNDDGINAGGEAGGLITINNGNIYVKASGDGIDSNDAMIINNGVVYSMGSSKGGDAALDTDNGFSIHGGLVIGLGYDMLQLPKDDSKQYSICYTLDSEIGKNTLVTLLDDKNNVVTSFIAKEKFKTLIISSDKITTGKYHLYINGNNTGTEFKNIFFDGEYSKGDLVKSVEVKDIITEVK